MDVLILDVPFFAYIDPMSGAILFQAIVGGILALGVMCRRYLFAAFSLVFRNRLTEGSSESGESGPADSSTAISPTASDNTPSVAKAVDPECKKQ